MNDRIVRRDQQFLDRRWLAQADCLRGFLPEPPDPVTEAGPLADVLPTLSPASAGAGTGEDRHASK